MPPCTLYNRIMQCNIDAKGKAVRLTGGIITTIIGLILAGLTLTNVIPQGPAIWAIAGITLISGAFMIFEGWNGWCVLRAMGIKTRI